MDPKARNEAVQEALFLKKMEHPNIIRFYEAALMGKWWGRRNVVGPPFSLTIFHILRVPIQCLADRAMECAPAGSPGSGQLIPPAWFPTPEI